MNQVRAVCVWELNNQTTDSYVARDGIRVGESSLRWLINEDHVGDVTEGILAVGLYNLSASFYSLPRIWVVVEISIRINTTWTELLEQAYHRRRSWASIDPYRQRSFSGISIASFEEPETDVLVLFNVHISTVGLYAGRRLADSIWNFFPSDVQAIVASG